MILGHCSNFSGSISSLPRLLVTGNDLGQERTREGVMFVNRLQANSGAKVFVTGMIDRSGKGLSLGQK